MLSAKRKLMIGMALLMAVNGQEKCKACDAAGSCDAGNVCICPDTKKNCEKSKKLCIPSGGTPQEAKFGECDAQKCGLCDEGEGDACMDVGKGSKSQLKCYKGAKVGKSVCATDKGDADKCTFAPTKAPSSDGIMMKPIFMAIFMMAVYIGLN